MTERIPPTRWIGSTLVGWIATIPLVGLFSSIGEGIGVGGARVFVALGVGAAIGGAQALSNRGTIVGHPRWLFVTAICLAIPGLILDMIRVVPLANPYALHASIAAGGVTVGIAQAKILSSRFANTAVWVIASIVGWTLFALGSAIPDLLLRGGRIQGIVGAGVLLGSAALGALALGAVTGWAIGTLRER